MDNCTLRRKRYICSLHDALSFKSRLTAGDLQGALYFQQLTKELVTNHRKEEDASGHQLWPATPTNDLPGSQEEIEFCASLDCASGVPELEW